MGGCDRRRAAARRPVLAAFPFGRARASKAF